jgi:hypothetical protein
MELVPKKVDESSEWVIILGSAGAVGSFAVQVLGFHLLQASKLTSLSDCQIMRVQSPRSMFPE